jgi:allophanate hydrolase subunit 1
VSAGSVAIGGEHTGIYSIASPGGWWLLGRTNAEIFSAEKARDGGSADAFLLRQGDSVKFLPVEELFH